MARVRCLAAGRGGSSKICICGLAENCRSRHRTTKTTTPATTSIGATRNRPVPIMEGTARGMPREYMVADQRFAARRPDVLVYQTEVLEADLAVAGPIEVELHVATSGTDADWVVKIIDVYPERSTRPQRQPARRAFRRLSATGARRRVPRQVPRQLREARAVRAR